MNCKHELSFLMGTSDGIVCRKCGTLFKSFDEIYPKAPEPAAEVAPAEKPKRQRRTKKDD